MFAVLGNITFNVLGSPESFEAERSYDYAKQKVVEARPRLQWMAEDLERLTLEIGLHVSYSNPAAARAALRAAAASHQALPLVFANGEHRGWYVISRITETHRQLADDGSLVSIALKLQLDEYARGDEIDPTAPPVPVTTPIGIAPAVTTPATPAPAVTPATPAPAWGLTPATGTRTPATLPGASALLTGAAPAAISPMAPVGVAMRMPNANG